MSKMKKISLAAAILIVVVFAGYKTWQKMHATGGDNEISSANAKIILFYGDLCPHCQDVEKYIADNKLDQKVDFAKLEIWSNSANANLMAKKANECGLKNDQIGVPFLWAEGKCLMGVNEVENFFDRAAGNQATDSNN